MSQLFQQRLAGLVSDPTLSATLSGIQRGIEKESLRIQANGKLAQTPHQQTLGAALTHPHITTDFSEALLEFITPVSTDIDQCLQFLHDIHSFTYSQIDKELLWVSSMPCFLEGDSNIPVAHYGSSNVAKMKTVYRQGLGNRYGRLMQTISGIHYNFSLPDRFWPQYQQQRGNTQNLQDFKTDEYFGLIRNFRRYMWLLVYLFGASPAVCKTFLRNRQHCLESIDNNSLGVPMGTALRMGDLGYQSSAQERAYVSYDNLSLYVESLMRALTLAHPAYEAMGVKVDNEYCQLNTNILQIENEFYSSIRPKRVTRSGQTPISALVEYGIEYIEVRCIDLNPFLPLGIDAEQIRFLDTFLMLCLLQESPPCNIAEHHVEMHNLKQIVNQGRKKNLMLEKAGQKIPLIDWAQQLFEQLLAVANVLDQANQCTLYRSAVLAQQEKIFDSEKTPSARIFANMNAHQLPYFRFAMQQAEQNQQYFSTQTLTKSKKEFFCALAAESINKQQQIEANDNISFSKYLADYYSQYDAISKDLRVAG